MHKYGVLIGRFEPYHSGHLSLTRFALQNVEELIIILGSCNVARSIKNPWSADERKEMILSCFDIPEGERITFLEASDYLYNDNRWLTCIQQQVDEVTDGEEDIVLIGEQKDRSSFYLKMFPQWKHLDAGEHFIPDLNATEIRSSYFLGSDTLLRPKVPPSVYQYLVNESLKPNYDDLVKEFNYIEAYKDKWSVPDVVPFPATFVTVDTVVIQSGHVLLVKRKGYPGKGLWALPGGFLNQHERIEDAALRELREETVIALPKEELRKLIVDRHVFDHPDRSARGRTITHAFCLNLGSGKLPRVKGSDDAEKAFWLPLKEVSTKENMFMEDHVHIIRYFCDRF
jgi:bifunctional NMN adenylyltransferase/nudix hydrolase